MLSYDRLADLLRPRVVFAKIAAGVLWVIYAASILLYPVRAMDGTVQWDGWFGAYNLKEQTVLADHLAFYTAARLEREGLGGRAYDYEFVAGYQNRLLPEGRWNSLEAFRNPPFYALLYYPTAGWHFPYSAWFWVAVQLGLLWVALRWLAQAPLSRLCGRGVGGEGPASSIGWAEEALRRGPPEAQAVGLEGSAHPTSPEPQPGAALTPNPSPAEPGEGGKTLSPNRLFLWALAFYPTFAAVSYGQNTLLSLFAFALCYRLLAADRRFLAGLAAGLLCFKPPLLIGLVVWGLLDLRRLWPCALGVIVCGAALCGVSYPLMPDMWAGFVKSLGENAEFANFHQFKMHNPIAFWRLLLPDVPDRVRWPLAVLLSLAAVGCFAWLWARCKRDLPAVYGGVVFLTLWASPHALIYEWALLLIPAVLWWPKTVHAPNRWFVLYAASWLVLFVSTHVSEGQQMAQNLFGAADPHGDPNALKPLWEPGPLAGMTAVAVQLSLPVLGWVGWSAARLLRESCPKPLP